MKVNRNMLPSDVKRALQGMPDIHVVDGQAYYTTQGVNDITTDQASADNPAALQAWLDSGMWNRADEHAGAITDQWPEPAVRMWVYTELSWRQRFTRLLKRLWRGWAP